MYCTIEKDRIIAKEIGKVAEILCSVVVPVYNEELVAAETCRRLKKVLGSLGCGYEIIFVDDGSVDGTDDILSFLCDNDRSIKKICFSRNFGHQAAITAGMEYSSGKTVVVIDADLQDPPELIPDMVSKWKEGFDVVYGIRSRRKGETLFKKVTSSLFYRLLKSITAVDMPLDAGDFRLVDRKVCDSLKKINERNRYVRGLISWLGFRQTGIEYVREKRFAGKTKYPFKKMLKFAWDGIASFSYKPLKLAGWCGFVITSLSMILLLTMLFTAPSGAALPPAGSELVGAVASSVESDLAGAAAPSVESDLAGTAAPSVAPIYRYETTAGLSPALVVSLLFNGIMLIAVGIIGVYTGRIYDEVKGRPLYIIRETKNFDS